MGLTSGSGRFPWRRKWQPTPVFLPGEFHGQRSLMSYSPCGREESNMTERWTLSLLDGEDDWMEMWIFPGNTGSFIGAAAWLLETRRCHREASVGDWWVWLIGAIVFVVENASQWRATSVLCRIVEGKKQNQRTSLNRIYIRPTNCANDLRVIVEIYLNQLSIK